MNHIAFPADLDLGRPRNGRPLIGVLCSNETLHRPVQTVASRFVAPLSSIAGATVLLVPAISGATDTGELAHRLDGLLLTGAQSNVSADRYGGAADGGDRLDPGRDAVALELAGRMIDAGRPVFGICRGLQEINVLFGGTLVETPGHRLADEEADSFAARFAKRHPVTLADGGWLAELAGHCRLEVNSVHDQGIGRLGSGLAWEAVADDGLIEAVSARPNGAAVLAVQWHPEWDIAGCPASRAFFAFVGDALRGQAALAG
jgi:putative glutamine amidotransferase